MTEIAHRKEQAALASILASSLLTLGKLAAGLLSGSLALISEAAHSLLDTGATIITYYAIKAAGKPADDEHHYGHGKIEAVAALGETGLLFVLAGFVLVEAVSRLGGHPSEPVEANGLTYGVLIIAISIDLVRWLSLRKIAKETNSDALAADALHFYSDMVGSVLVLLGLIATQFGFQQGDTLAAIGVALFIAIAGYRLGRKTIDTLVDVAPPGMADHLRKIVSDIPQVVAIDQIRLRPAGTHIFGEIVIAVPRTHPLEKVPAIKEAISAALLQAYPELIATITANPRALDEETIIERVLLIAARRGLPIHHLTIQDINGTKSVSLDLEIDGRLTHGEAHDTATHLEAAIRDEIGMDIEVETHIEPLDPAERAGTNADAKTIDEIQASIARHALSGAILTYVHDVRVRAHPSGLVVNYHCWVDPNLSVDAVHSAVDAVDRRVRRDFTHITRIVGHAEPPQQEG
jgi:cation diffusion facilitator family transporter